ncbi:ABC transporter substrate-binding protein [Falsigemmobacter faecalis]|uniref:ABC transporter substrate-binding protein n=1 Tax=Falsigemmobacter faecalis TaxID=2488730 RepID=A0A3P3DSW0_9RHOB|nr:ABC transporter substrate-binding protein [Falsigemmobacter faecalis]RRH77245.1 ABC transporter substrate-binding protein [Falsigemmobacter faecalis]
MMRSLSLAALLALGTAATAFAETPRKGGTFNFTAPYGSAFSTLDIHSSPNIQEHFVTYAIHRSLYSWDSYNNKPVPELAESVDISDDRSVYTFHLKKNAVFHNGKPLTVDDVIFTYKRLADAKNALPGASYINIIKGVDAFGKGEATEIEGLKKIDDHTLEVTLNAAGNPGFNLMESTTSIYPSDYPLDQQAIKPVGLGAFQFKEHVPGSQVVVERFDNYYEEGKPYLDRVNIIVMPEGSARDVAFRNKEVDVSVLGPVQYQAYQQDPALKDHILEVAETFTRNVGFNQTAVPALADKRVRQAINYAINSDLIIERLVKGKAVRAVSWLPAGSPAFDDTAQPYAFDPEKAKALLKEAGFENGFEFEVTATPNESWGVPIIEAILPMLKQVGITVKPKPIESAALGSTVSAGDFQAYMWSNLTGPDPLTVLRCFWSQTAQSACNYTNFSNAEFDKLYEAARAEADEAKQMDLLKQANNLLQEEAPVWFFNYNKAVMAYQPWVHGLAPNATELALQDYDSIWIDDSAPASRK